MKMLEENLLDNATGFFPMPGGKIEKTPPGRTGWLKDILGDDRFRYVEGAELTGESVSDAELRQLNALPNLRSIVIIAPDVSAEGFAQLRGSKVVDLCILYNVDDSGRSWNFLASWQQLRKLSFERCSFGDDGILKLPLLPNLTELCLSQTNITDEGLRGIPLPVSLEVLDLSNTSVTDAGLQHLSHLTNLRQLNLGDTEVAGPGLIHLAGLPDLAWLALDKCRITDDGLAPIARLTELQNLYLRNQHSLFTDAGLAHLRGLKNLKHLSLRDNANVTDDGMSNLSRLTSLETLDLAGTRISDAGLLHLNGLFNLRDLSLGDTEVTRDGERAIYKALPKLHRGLPGDQSVSIP